MRRTRAAAPSKPESKKDEQSRRTRRALLQAAARLFAAHGYRDTSVQAIGESAGVSRGSIFWHFGSKEGLLLAVVERVFAQWEEESLAPVLGEETSAESLADVVETHRRLLAGQRQFGRLFFVLMFEALGPRPELLPAYTRLYRRFRTLATGWIERGIRAGQIPADTDADAAATVVLGALGGVHYQWHLDPGAVDLGRTHDAMTRLLGSGLFRAPAEARSVPARAARRAGR